MTHRRVVLAALLISSIAGLSSTGFRSNADPEPLALPRTLRGLIHPSGFRVLSSAPEEIRLTVSIPALQLRHLGRSDYRLTLDGGEPLAVDRAPDIPVYRRLVAVANGGEVSVEARVNSSKVLDGVTLRTYQNRVDHLGSSRSPFRQPTALRTQATFPHANAVIEYEGHLRGQRIASILVCPVQYNAALGKVTVATDLEIVVKVEHPDGDVIHDIGPMDAALSGSVLNWVTGGSSSASVPGFASDRVNASAGVKFAGAQVRHGGRWPLPQPHVVRII